MRFFFFLQKQLSKGIFFVVCLPAGLVTDPVEGVEGGVPAVPPQATLVLQAAPTTVRILKQMKSCWKNLRKMGGKYAKEIATKSMSLLIKFILHGSFLFIYV